MRQCGTITALEGNRAKVLMQRHSSCGNCSACKMGKTDMSMEIEAINNVNAHVGDWVEVDMENQDVLRAAFIIYAIPLFALIIGVILGNRILKGVEIQIYREVGSVLIGFAFMTLSFITIRSREKSINDNKAFIPVITEVIDVEKKF